MDVHLHVSIDGFRFNDDSDPCCKSKNPRETQNPSSDDFVVLKYINDMLMEEDLEGQSCMLQDSLALQAAERSFYEILHDQSSLSNHNSNNQYNDIHGKSRPRNGEDLESGRGRGRGRAVKQPTISSEIELSENFEELLLSCTGNKQEESRHSMANQNQEKRSKWAKSYSNPSQKSIDLQSLLMQCAQAVASFDHKTATEKLKEIRSHSCRYGDGSRRLAFYFGEALQKRIVGKQSPEVYSILPCGRTSMVDILKAYKLYVKASPFNKMSYYVANKTIVELTSKATKLHIIDFGILYGFQWPCLIQALSNRPNGPPLLRITGIEMPQPGYRPSERVEETGKRLKRFCDRFNVPFEYNFIAKKWENISPDELVMNKEEITVVNCLYRLRYVPDETVAMNSPRDIVLKLFKDINPDLFVFAEVNGMYNSPFFVTRFREALFHFSSLFDIFEATTEEDNEYRTLMEREIFVRDAMNVISCEGVERIERPETYKQWQVRATRAKFRPVELQNKIMKDAKEMVRRGYHKDFVIDADRHWMFQGWKGRVLYALSCWKPAEK